MTSTSADGGAAPAAPVARPFRAGLPARLRATAIRFGVTVVLAAVTLAVTLLWYPGFHFGVDGGWHGLRTLVAVDLGLGPLLTFVIFNPFKTRLAIGFDLVCLGIVQAMAAGWGLHAIHAQRPVAVTFQAGGFHGVTARPLAIEKFALDDLAALSPGSPALVYVAPPQNEGEQTRVAMQELIGEVMGYEDPFFFRPFEANWPAVRASGRSAERERPADAAAFDAFVARHGGDASQWLFYDYQGRFGTCTLAFTPDGRLVGGFGWRAS